MIDGLKFWAAKALFDVLFLFGIFCVFALACFVIAIKDTLERRKKRSAQ